MVCCVGMLYLCYSSREHWDGRGMFSPTSRYLLGIHTLHYSRKMFRHCYIGIGSEPDSGFNCSRELISKLERGSSKLFKTPNCFKNGSVSSENDRSKDYSLGALFVTVCQDVVDLYSLLSDHRELLVNVLNKNN